MLPTMSDQQPLPDLPDQHLWYLWRQGERPELRTFLDQFASLSVEEVAAVVSVDQRERWSIGERVPAERYLGLHSGLGTNEAAACDIVYGEYLLREQLGESPTFEEYRRRFPRLAAVLQRQIELHHALALSREEEPQQSSALPTVLDGPVVPSTDRPVVPGYQLLEELGRGGMGVVYKALQLSLQRIVAIKVLHCNLAASPAALERIRHEAQVTARLSHPHIVTVYDAREVGDRFFFALEYVPGIDLQRLVERSGPLPVAVACEYIRQAALGLQHAHEHGLVHRDIKPSNLMVCGGTFPTCQEKGTLETCRHAPGAQRTTHQVKLLDLGLARQVVPLTAGKTPGGLTHIGAFMGTPDFISPEQADDPRNADRRSDLYSLGCTLYYLLTGSVPFKGRTTLEKLLKHRIEEPDPLSKYCPQAPRAVVTIVHKLMAKAPEDRFQTAAELAQALAPFSDSLEETADRRTGSLPGPASGQAGSPSYEAQPVPDTEPPGPRVVPSTLNSTPLHRFSGHTDWVKSVACSPDGNRLISGGLDQTVQMWDVMSGEEMGSIQAHSGGVLAVCFSPDGRTVLSAGADHLLRLWETRTTPTRSVSEGTPREVPSQHKPQAPARGHPHSGWACEGAPNCVRSFAGHGDNVNAATFTPTGEHILSASHDGTVRLWDVATGRELHSFVGHTGPVWSVAVSPDGQFALSGGQDRTLRLWDLKTGRALPGMPDQVMPVNSVAFSPDGRLALCAGMDGMVRVWDLSTRSQVQVFKGHTRKVTCAGFALDGKFALSGSRDCTLRLWEVASGREKACFTGHSHWVTSLAFTPDGVHAVSASADRSVCLWRLPG
jgi:WD40 repeat protein